MPRVMRPIMLGALSGADLILHPVVLKDPEHRIDPRRRFTELGREATNELFRIVSARPQTRSTIVVILWNHGVKLLWVGGAG
jgi:hypothetical protein